MSVKYHFHQLSFATQTVLTCRWTFNPAVLSKVNRLSANLDSVMEEALASLSLEKETHRSNPPSSSRAVPFVEGDIVQVFNDRERIQMLQPGHGEWTDAMIPVRIL